MLDIKFNMLSLSKQKNRIMAQKKRKLGIETAKIIMAETLIQIDRDGYRKNEYVQKQVYGRWIWALVTLGTSEKISTDYYDNNEDERTDYLRRYNKGHYDKALGKVKECLSEMSVMEVNTDDKFYSYLTKIKGSSNELLEWLDKGGANTDVLAESFSKIYNSWLKRAKNKDNREKFEKKIAQDQKYFEDSEYLEDLGVRRTLKVVVHKIIDKPDYTIIIFADRNGNQLFTYGDKAVWESLSGFTPIKATPKRHQEKFGIKSTYINRVSILN